MRYPVDTVLPEVIERLAAHRSAVLIAPTGAGKTTRVPPALAEREGAGLVILLEPRRVAARAAATRMAQELGEKVGESVGYQVRFERRAGPKTRILVVTEGILTRKLQDDPLLESVRTLVFDEFHERHLEGDLALALAAEVRRELRPELELLVMSATLDPGPVSAFLDDAPLVRSEGRLHPVDIRHEQLPSSDPLEEKVARAVSRGLDASERDLLVFLPGAAEIRRCAERLEGRVGNAELQMLHGDLPLEEQSRVLRSGARRRIVLSTNLAESSLTLEGLDCVIDSGLVRQLVFDADAGIDRLETRRISRASAAQRAGRAGRLGPGVAFRLWTRGEERELEERDTPEIRRIDLSACLLQLLAWGVGDPTDFAWFEAPDEKALRSARQLLELLGAVDARTGRITARGRLIASLPLHPRLARLLIEAAERGVFADGCVLAALASERDPRRRGRRLEAARSAEVVARSDLLLHLDLFHEAKRGQFRSGLLDRLGLDRGAMHRVRRSVDQLLRYERRLPTAVHQDDDEDRSLLKCVLAAYPDRVARRRRVGENEALLVGGKGVRLADESCVSEAELFVATRIQGLRGPNALVRSASAIEEAWLSELDSDSIVEETRCRFDEAGERVLSLRVRRFHDLVLDERRISQGDATAEGEALAAALLADPERALKPSDGVKSLLARLGFLREHCPELQLPEAKLSWIAEQLHSSCYGRRSFAELRTIRIEPLVLGLLNHEQRRALDEEAPERLALPAGGSARIHYDEGGPPRLAARVQELFGMRTTPRIARGRVPLLIELLAPSRRPVQRTQDLESFWANTYAQVRKDLRGRYPKHAWPENPP